MGRFADTAQLRNWNLFRTVSSEEAVGYIVELCPGSRCGASSPVGPVGVRRVSRGPAPAGGRNPLSRRFSREAADSREQVRARIIESGIGITGADYAVAETGSVVVLPRKGLSRLVSLVPPVHVAVVRIGDVVETLDDVFLFRRLEYHRNGGEMGSYLNFITGPSRTADIEMKLVVGVHGPREVHLVLLG